MDMDMELGNSNSSDADLRPSLTMDGRVPVIEGWDGDSDPANPMNWSGIKKTVHVGTVSILAFIP